MKWSFLIISFLYSITVYGQITDLTIHIKDIDPPMGYIQMALYNAPEDFPIEGKEFKVIRVQISGRTVSTTIKDLPNGKYALALFHDLNNDGICNKNLLGFPVEGYGFSNNIKPKIRAPRFDKAAFDLTQKDFLEISMVY